MAKFWKCDGCGKEFNELRNLREVEFPHMNNWKNQFSDETEGYRKEVCAQCARALIDRFEVLSHKAEKEK